MACLVSLKASVLIHCSWMMGKKTEALKYLLLCSTEEWKS